MVYMPHWPKELGYKPGDFFLDRILILLDKLGNPHKKMNAPIHVTGTNGKGSTVAFIRSILEESGYSVNAYTSPHLVDFNERIVLSGNKISDDFLFSVLEECRIASQGMEVTFFEGTTAAAFLAFSLCPADFNIIEVGMGGRLDATNVIDSIVSVFASISLDHIEFLGPAVEIIANEKAGIMRPGAPAVIGEQDPSVMHVLESYAAKNGTPVFRNGYEWNSFISNDHMWFEDKFLGEIYQLSPPKHLLGMHQIKNAGNAVAVCSILSSKYGYDVCLESISDGIMNARWAGRIERIKKGELVNILPENCELYMDGCHNSGGAQVLADWIVSLGDVDVYTIVGLTKGKDMDSFFAKLKPHVKFTCLVCVKSEVRGETTHNLKICLERNDMPGIECESITEGIRYLSGIVNGAGRKSIVIVCGSLFLAKDLVAENV